MRRILVALSLLVAGALGTPTCETLRAAGDLFVHSSGDPNCSPSTDAGCREAPNPACEFEVPNYDSFSDLVGGVECKTCEQSSEIQCTHDGLVAILGEPGARSVQAAYCNDEYLVLWSKGLPNHELGLGGIPRPPGAGSAMYT